MPNLPGPSLFWALLLFPLPLQAAVYSVGPNQPYASIGSVPWESITAGDTVRIHYRDTPYNETWVISAKGTQSNPILVQGVPGPNGALPVIDGRNATTRAQLSFWGQTRSVIKIGASSVPNNATATWITVENLEVRSGRAPYTFTDSTGTLQTYDEVASSIRIEDGEHITIRNCIIRDSGNGFLTSPGTRDIVIEGSYLYDNGGGDGVHQAYTESIGILYQYNHFGPLRAGTRGGSNLKDRSAGNTIRYNWIEGGNRQLDIPDATTDEAILDPRYRESFVYGNVFIEPDDDGLGELISYGGDMGIEANYRKGTLYFYHNTIVSERRDSTTLFKIKTNEESVDCRNNTVYAAHPSSPLAVMAWYGNITLRNNWLSMGWLESLSSFSGSFDDDGSSLEGFSPYFYDETTFDLHPTLAFAGIDEATVLHGAALPDDEVLEQYVRHQDIELRPDDGQTDVGAFELSPTQSTVVTVTSSALPAAAVGVSYARALAATGGTPPYRWSLLGGTLPAGLQFDATTGLVKGTPTTSTSSSLTVQVTDSASPSTKASRTIGLRVDPAPVLISTTTLPDGRRKKPYNATLTASRGVAPYQWRLTVGTLPPGLVLNSQTGLISGTPTKQGNYSFTVQAIDSQTSPSSDSQELTLRIRL